MILGFSYHRTFYRIDARIKAIGVDLNATLKENSRMRRDAGKRRDKRNEISRQTSGAKLYAVTSLLTLSPFELSAFVSTARVRGSDSQCLIYRYKETPRTFPRSSYQPPLIVPWYLLQHRFKAEEEEGEGGMVRQAASGSSLAVYDSLDCVKAERKLNEKETSPDKESKFQWDEMRFVRLFPDRLRVGKRERKDCRTRGITIPYENVTLIGKANSIDRATNTMTDQQLL